MKKEIYSTISKFYPFKSLDSFALTYHSINDFNHDFTPKKTLKVQIMLKIYLTQTVNVF